VKTILSLVSACLLAAPSFAETSAEAAPQPKPYPFTFCIVQGTEFEEYKEPYVITHEGQQYKVCCKDCLVEFQADPAPHVEKFAALLKKRAAAAKPYPLATCVVSGETLGSHGEPYVMQHEGREVRLCCKGCRKDFLKDPASYLKRIDEAAAKTAAE
jgi:YHS domain-containing protein